MWGHEIRGWMVISISHWDKIYKTGKVCTRPPTCSSKPIKSNAQSPHNSQLPSEQSYQGHRYELQIFVCLQTDETELLTSSYDMKSVLKDRQSHIVLGFEFHVELDNNGMRGLRSNSECVQMEACTKQTRQAWGSNLGEHHKIKWLERTQH